MRSLGCWGVGNASPPLSIGSAFISKIDLVTALRARIQGDFVLDGAK
jgi:hypothetical protein